MAFKSLLLSKDTETVLALTRLLKDLDISAEPCTEPFAAAKRLMDQHFDAILVDCEDEQGAGWVLQSARMAVASKKCVTIAIVGAQSAGRSKGGENFVIQKPIVLKQVESTLRAARNLMSGGPVTSPAETASAVPAAAASSASAPAQVSSSAQGRPPVEMFDELTAAVDRLGPQAAPPKPLSVPSSLSAGAAAAPAPAWEKPLPVPSQPVQRPGLQSRASASPSAPASESLLPLTAASEMKSVVRPSPDAAAGSSAAIDEMRRKVLAAPHPAWRTEAERPEPPAPRFSAFPTEVEPSRPFPFKAIAVAMVLVSIALFGYSWHRNRHAASVPPGQPQASAPVTAAQPAPETPATVPAAPVAGSPSDESATPVAEVKPDETPAPEPVSHTKSAAVKPAEETATVADDSSLPPAPLVVSGGKVETPAPAPSEEAPVAPGLDAVASAAKPDLGGVVTSTAARLPQMAPVEAPPQRIRVSQGVTQGLLVHQVSPQYPAMARESRVEGDVVLEAVIGKDGTVRGLKALSGPPLLVSSAISAVRQWRYKPYLLNGEPVEVETQIKLQFRL